MGIFAEEIVTTDTLGRRSGPRTRHTIEEKLRIVQETRAREASVATVVLRGRTMALCILVHRSAVIPQSKPKTED